MRYLAILGQNRELSLAELLAVYPDIKIENSADEAVVLSSTEKINLDRLGGLPKLAEISGEAADIAEAKKIIIEELKKFPQDKKIFFGLSFYNNENRKKYMALGKEIKKELRDDGYKLRWVSSNEMALSSVIIKTNKLLTRGFDFNIVFNNGKATIAKTVAVQDFSDYEFRDMRRPARDLLSGMTPPKLAKIMVNLALNLSPLFRGGDARRAEGVLTSPHPASILPLRAGKITNVRYLTEPEASKERGEVKKKTFLDPFCGSGTFLAEAALLGFKKLCGSDVSAKAVSDSQKNFSWLKEKYNLPQEAEIKLCDIKNISACWQNKFDSIATEPYLGPPIRGQLSSVQAEKLQKELSALYEIYLKNLSVILEKNGTLVLIVPFFISGGDKIKINLELKKTGLGAVREPILYSRPDQKIGREIYILKKM